MNSSSQLNWNCINEYVLALEASQSSDQLLQTAIDHCRSLMPAVDHVAIYTNADSKYLVGKRMAAALVDRYNQHYARVNPYSRDYKITFPEGPDYSQLEIIDWTEHRDLEYTEDFLVPLGVQSSMIIKQPGLPLRMSIQRFMGSPRFTENELSCLKIVNLHINSLYRLFESRGRDKAEPISACQIMKLHTGITAREAEVCALVAGRLTTQEIAKNFCLSPRTVDRHLENIFAKLGVRSRQELRTLLLQDAERKPDAKQKPGAKH